MAKRILIVATSHDKLNDGSPTGLWAEELVVPYFIWEKAGARIDIVSVKGGRVPVDPGSLSEGGLTEEVKLFLGDESRKALLENTLAVKDVKDEYDVIYFPGGHGPVFDIASDKDVIALAEKFWAAGKVVAAVCHGSAGLVGLKTPEGEPIVKGKLVTGFSNAEEEVVKKEDKIPFLLETVLVEQGAKFQKASLFKECAVADGKLITGQNPASSPKLAQLVLEAIA